MTNSWQSFISERSSAVSFASPATQSAIIAAEAQLGVSLPKALSALLLESDGVEGEDGLGLIWPILRIQQDNLAFRVNADFKELYMPFDPLLFFGDAGNGDQFAFVILAGEIRNHDVFVWNHENDSRSWVAPDLGTYLEWFLSGKIDL